MRVGVLVCVVALSLSCVAARADSTVVENFTANGDTPGATNPATLLSGSFAQFDTSLGTLDSITVQLSGNAAVPSADPLAFTGIAAPDDPSNILVAGQGSGVGSINFS